MSYVFLADAIGVFHAMLVLFVVAGQGVIMLGWAKGWTWPRNWLFRSTHVFVIGWVVVQAWLGERCFLTDWENELRAMAGQQGYSESFIEYWIHSWMFWTAPFWVFVVIYTIFGALVMLSFLAYRPDWSPLKDWRPGH